MAVEVAGYRSRKRNEQAKHAAKAKKEKILLAVCGAILVALLAFQGPKMLKKLHGSKAAAPATVAPSTSSVPDTAAQAATAAGQAADLRAARRFASKDPFAAQLDTGTAAAPEAASVAAPTVHTSHFVKKDLFVQQLSFATATTSAPTPTAPAAAGAAGTGKKASGAQTSSGSGNYIVMVASIPVSDGRAAARAAAATARSHGVPSVKIVESSRYPTLRTGFYAVYSGPYPTLGELLPALEQVRGDGYASAYTRRLAH
jgi:hypothetical protein